MLENRYRTHTCGFLTRKNIGEFVLLAGWVYRKRDHGGLLFIDLIDHYGITQVVAEEGTEFFDTASRLKIESVISIEGYVKLRSEDTINPDLNTGEIEIKVDKLRVESVSKDLPFEVDSGTEANEDIRLRYRFLDLRRKKMQENIKTRSKVLSCIRSKMEDMDFLEIITPILTASSPEGARDYLVPSRVHEKKFYALPQAPQIFKQILMISRFDKYYQIAPCFRDEDARADRSPGEFYQLDVEMSFATRDQLFSVMEDVLYSVFKNFSKKELSKPPFLRMTYAHAMLRYGTDKPDLRNPIEISDVTEVFKDSNFSIFAKNIDKGMIVRVIPAPNTCTKPRSFFEKKIDYVRSLGAGGLAYIIFDEDGNAKGPIAKLLDDNILSQIKKIAGVGARDSVFFSCDFPGKAELYAGEARKVIGEELNILEKDCYKFCWIIDFPYFERDEKTGKIEFSHNPFSMPYGEMDALQNKNPLEILANQYDCVCNGVELSSGAVRNHKIDVLYKAFEIAGYKKEEVDKNFGSLINAFGFGAPNHCGMAIGFDRMLAMLTDSSSLRDVIAFPLNQKAQDLMMGAPSEITDKQRVELHLKKPN